MRTVPVVEMKSHLSALLAEVARGEEVAISRHGRVIARLVPDTPKMAADAFRSFWGEEEIDLEAPDDMQSEAVPSLD
jgi:prevent-host-death family protein